MQRFIPVVGLLVASYYIGTAGVQTSKTASVITAPSPGDPAAESPSSKKSAASQRPDEPVHKSLIRFLTDTDDLLDTIHDPASFAAVKPKLLRRAREQADLAAQHPNQGMSQLSKSAAKELQTAINRHSESLERAIRVAPGVQPFFEKELAAILNPK
jgi:hypothetical protein